MSKTTPCRVCGKELRTPPYPFIEGTLECIRHRWPWFDELGITPCGHHDEGDDVGDEKRCVQCGRSEAELREEERPLRWNPSGHTCGWCDYRVPPITGSR